MLQLTYDSCLLGLRKEQRLDSGAFGSNIREIVQETISVHSEFNFYLLHNGKIVESNDMVNSGVVHVIPRLEGGKGGFGSMLRAIGAQIEKTTNREACRDLSGRRLRDINEEKRLKKWIAEQADREKEAVEKKKRKLDKLCAEPKHDFSDAEYDKTRSEMTDKVHDAVEQGLKAAAEAEPSCSTSMAPKTSGPVLGNKKPKGLLWDDMEELGSDDSELDEEEGPSPVKKLRLTA